MSKMNDDGVRIVVVGAYDDNNNLIGKQIVPLVCENFTADKVGIYKVVCRMLPSWVAAMVKKNGGKEFNLEILRDEILEGEGDACAEKIKIFAQEAEKIREWSINNR